MKSYTRKSRRGSKTYYQLRSSSPIRGNSIVLIKLVRGVVWKMSSPSRIFLLPCTSSFAQGSKSMTTGAVPLRGLGLETAAFTQRRAKTHRSQKPCRRRLGVSLCLSWLEARGVVWEAKRTFVLIPVAAAAFLQRCDEHHCQILPQVRAGSLEFPQSELGSFSASHSCSGVQMTGGSKPLPRQTDAILF